VVQPKLKLVTSKVLGASVAATAVARVLPARVRAAVERRIFGVDHDFGGGGGDGRCGVIFCGRWILIVVPWLLMRENWIQGHAGMDFMYSSIHK
jgi:hypothetical protein